MSEPMQRTLSDVGEFEVVAALRERLVSSRGVEVGPGDDAAVVAAPDARVVVTTDTLVDRVHFRQDWASGYDIGRRACAASLADISAMGARATALVVSLSCPPTTLFEWALQLAEGLADECDEVEACVVGGDLTSSPTLSVTVTALGDLAGRRPVLRSGARVGDVVAVSGRHGWAEAGMAVLSRGFTSPRALVDAYRRPTPPYASGPAAADVGATAMVDVSDGLLSDLGHIARESGVVAALDTQRFVVPEPLAAVAAAYGTDPVLWMLTGGQDHAILATFPSSANLPPGFVVVGDIVDNSGSEGESLDEAQVGVTVDGERFEGATGHRHF